MARIRTIKPSFFTSLTIADLTLEQRLTFIGLWTHVDDEGRCVYDPRLIRAAIWPLDDRSLADIEDDIRAITDRSLIRHYKVGNRTYLAVNGWSEHQKINRPKPSTLPGPEGAEIASNSSPNDDHGIVTDESLIDHCGKGKEGKGKEAPSAGAIAPRTGGPTQLILGEWLGSQSERPPTAVVNQLAKHVTGLVRDGIAHDLIRAGLDQWATRGLHPSVLPSVVHEVQTRPGRSAKTRQQAATDDLFDAAMQRAQAKEINS